jgi:hypothetical protein
MTDQLKTLHGLWCKLTGQSPDEIRYATCERLLFDYVNNGFTEDNLLHVLTFIMHQNQKASHPRYRTRLLFHRIMDLETFASILGEAGPWYRNRKRPHTEKARTVAAFRGEAPAVEQPGSTRHISEIFKALP